MCTGFCSSTASGSRRGGVATTRIATLGPEGSFSEEAAAQYGSQLGGEVTLELLDNPEDILSLSRGVGFGMVAIENSLEGSIGHTMDLLRTLEHPICGEFVMRIRHFLLGSKGRGVKRIFSHPAALAQCRLYIRRRHPEAEVVAASSTAQGALRASQEDSSAAIASLRAAGIYGLDVLAKDIQDEESHTRFIVVGRNPAPPTGTDKTSLIFAVKDVPGALHSALAPFSLRGINLTKIESRPSRRALGEYVFFVDFEGHHDDGPVRSTLKELGGLCTFVKVLGSYPAATFPPRR